MITIAAATKADAPAILALQKLAYESEARLYDDWSLPPLTQTIESLRDEVDDHVVLKAQTDGRLIGSVRAKLVDGICEIGRLIVHPDLQRCGIGSRLLREIEDRFDGASRFRLFTGSLSEANIRLYQSRGYRVTEERALSEAVTLVYFEKRVG